MASITILSISLLLLLLILPSTSFTTATSSSSSLQKLLHNQGLPVQLDGPCLAKFENRVFFDSVVRANLSFGGLIGLEGLAQEELFLWFPVKGIFVRDPDSGVILMDLGLAHKQLPVSLFEDPPSCQEPQGTLTENPLFACFRHILKKNQEFLVRCDLPTVIEFDFCRWVDEEIKRGDGIWSREVKRLLLFCFWFSVRNRLRDREIFKCDSLLV
ncbi:hypothetical protein LINGRAPRIM_LOCUS502 [Linum grandiflorum]